MDVERYAQKVAEDFLRKGRVDVPAHLREGHLVEAYSYLRPPKGAIAGTYGEMEMGLTEYFQKKGVYFAEKRARDIMSPSGHRGEWLMTWIKPKRANVKHQHLTSFTADMGIRVITPNPRIAGHDLPGGSSRDAVAELKFVSPIKVRKDGAVTLGTPKITVTEKPHGS